MYEVESSVTNIVTTDKNKIGYRIMLNDAEKKTPTVKLHSVSKTKSIITIE